MSETTRHDARGGAPARVEARRLARERMLRRRRRVFLLAVLAAAVVIVGADVIHGGTGDPPPRVAAATHTASTPRAEPVRHASAAPSASTPPAITYPRDGSGQFVTATGQSKVYGHGGTLLRFQVQVEKDIKHVDLTGFADNVVAILGNAQGWTAGGQWQFQRVGPGAPHDFVLHLVTPGTRDAMCHDVPEGYTSCRYEDDVMINVSRWVHGVPFYADLDVYRDYAVSHEVGHRLGHGHELCPGAGQKAPTMMQQTLGMHGCVPQPWPYPKGKLYDGPEGDYPQSNIPHDPASYYTH